MKTSSTSTLRVKPILSIDLQKAVTSSPSAIMMSKFSSANAMGSLIDGDWNAANTNSITNPTFHERTQSLFYIPQAVKMELEKIHLVARKKKLCGGKVEKIILQGVSCNIAGGEIMAIMGPSGAGKTSLLNCATLNNPRCFTMSGKVKLNGVNLTYDLFRKHCYIVYQRDFLAPKLTCRETLVYAAINCIKDRSRIEEHVEELIQNLGLENCQHTFVGDEFHQGLSGGQKRRLSLCLGMVKMPKILFLDEPTSGLDAVSAFKTCKQLRKITISYNIAAVLTIHQPNTKIYDTFKKLLLLKDGQVAYFGQSDQAETWFANRGYKLPKRTNMADFLLDIVEDDNYVNTYDGEVGPPPDVNSMGTLTVRSMLTIRSDRPMVKLTCRPSPSRWREIWWTLKREALLIFRDPMLYSGRCAAFAVLSVFFGTVYFESRERNQEQVNSRLWLVLWLVGVPSAMACIVVFVHCEETINMARSVRNGILHPVSFLMARFLKVPVMIAFSVSSVTIGGYLMGNWYWPEYASVVLVNALNLLIFEMQAELLAVLAPNFGIGMLAFMGFWFAGFVFCGLMIRDSDLILPLRAMGYVIPLRYGLKTILHVEYINSEFAGAEICDAMNSTQCRGGGFRCDQEYPCFGSTGEQVLDSLHYSYPILSSDDDLGANIGFMLAYCLVMLIAYVARIIWIVRRN